MKNLSLFHQKNIFTACENACCVSVDELTGVVAISSEQKLVVLDRNGSYYFRSDNSFGQIILCKSYEHSTVYIVFRFGILLWRYSDDTVLDSFSITQAIEFASFSPERSHIALVSADNLVTLLTLSLKHLSTVNLTQDGFGKAAPVTVGWGKKETQFQGSKGKQLSLSQSEMTYPSSDSGLQTLAWRDDGQYFVVSCLDTKQGNQRYLRIFTQSGELFSTSEQVGGLEPTLCWRPRVQLITTTRRRPTRGLDVLFFESNAERHGDFELLDENLESYYSVHQISFDEHGDVLAALCFPRCEQSQKSPPFIRLITCSNYKWSVKRDFIFKAIGSPFDGTIRGPIAYTWTTGSPRVGLCSLLSCQPMEVKSDAQTLTGTLLRSWSLSAAYDFHYWSAASPTETTTSGSPGFIAVIDKCSVQLTALAHSVIPPPMCSTRITFGWGPDAVSNVLCPTVSSVSFPTPWVDVPDHSPIPLLIQLESLSSFPELIVLYLCCGVDGHRCKEINLGRFILDFEWLTGSQKTAPWPKYAHVVDLSSLASCWPYGTELNHFCWISYSQVAFVAWGGYRIGLLELGNTDASESACPSSQLRWIVLLDTCPQSSGQVTTSYDTALPRFCGLCLDPDGYLCALLTNGNVLFFGVTKLLSSVNPTIIPSNNGELLFLDMSDPPHHIASLPLPCEQLAVIRLISNTEKQSTRENRSREATSFMTVARSILLGFHKPSQRLYGVQIPSHSADYPTRFSLDRPEPASVLMELCSSFIILPNFLLVTSVRRLLVCVPLLMDPSALTNPVACFSELTTRLSIPPSLISMNPVKSHNWYDDYLHPIERDALLVSAIPNEARVILQPPRGNLEEVHPRALVLTLLANLLNSLDYVNALELMRRHRINLNLLHDHNPVKFMRNLDHLVKTVANTDLITLFVSELVNEDVSQTVYGKFYGSPSAQLLRNRPAETTTPDVLSSRSGTKVNNICDALIHRMRHDKRFLLPVLTCYAKKIPSDLHSALLQLQEYHECGENQVWESGVKHLQYFATPVELYRIALGTYNLDLAQLMAQRTKLDPKEYLTDLNDFRAVAHRSHPSDNPVTNHIAYQRFRIDHHLQRYSKALDHLNQAGPEYTPDLINYAEDHHLHHQAMEYFEPYSKESKLIGRSWASHLVKEQKLYLAGLVYLRCGLFASAARVFLSCLQARMWSIAAAQARTMRLEDADADVCLGEQEHLDQARKLASRLQDLGRHDEAIMIYTDHLKDPNSALISALNGGCWVEARRLASLYSIAGLLDKNMKPKLMHSYSNLFEQLSEVRTEFTKLFERLTVLRRIHKDEAQANRIAESSGDINAIDHSNVETESFSDDSSMSGTSTSGSIDGFSLRSSSMTSLHRSTKGRKKETRRWSTKPGSKYEEVGLLNSLTRSIQCTQRLADEVATLIVELWNVGLVTEGRKLQQHMNELLADQKTAIPMIWDKCITEKVKYRTS
ncbi:unnamed protein product [Dicrocoelium dendriticum]|nr:unnamed protein product [Dicrocoelium dendriticum]